ncbi:MAG: sensor domain-containing diguanylate cyclase [Actinomycetota bacterium]|nr:sensor domain-containing diguanylate cyclase [Actinomycetota bacterium]
MSSQSLLAVALGHAWEWSQAGELLGLREPVERWDKLLSYSEPRGRLRFIDHRTAIPPEENLFSWVPELDETSDPDAWHPMDALFAPLVSRSGELMGVLSVDMPVNRRRPDAIQLELLEIFASQAALAMEHARMHEALKDRESELRHAATHDTLTGLANRALLMEQGAQVTAAEGGEVAVVVIDLDGFKAVNDRFGHHAGDAVLVALAERMRHAVRSSDLVARVGGDEFVIVLAGEGVEPLASGLADGLERVLCDPVRGVGEDYRVGASAGFSVAGRPAELELLLARADQRMYERKRARGRR